MRRYRSRIALHEAPRCLRRRRILGFRGLRALRISNKIRRALLLVCLAFSLEILFAAPRSTIPPNRGKPAPVNEPEALPPCYPPAGEPVSAQKIMRDLLDGKNVDLQARVIEGGLDADAFWPPADDRVTNLRVVPGRLRLDGCRILGRVSFPHVVFLQEVALTCTEILGDVDISDTDLRGGFVGEHSRFLGSVRLSRVNTESGLNFKNAFFESGLELNGGRFGVTLSGAEIRGDVDVKQAMVSSIDATLAKIGGSLRLDEALVLKSFKVTQTQIDRGLVVSSTKVKGPFDVTESYGKAPFSLSDVSVSNSLIVPLVNSTALTMTNVTASQSLVMLDGLFGDVTLQRVTVVGSTELEGATFSGRVSMSDSDFGQSFRATEALFQRDVEFRTVHFPGDDPMQGALFTRSPLLIDTVLPKPPDVVSDDDTEGDEDTNGADDEDLGPGGPDDGDGSDEPDSQR